MSGAPDNLVKALTPVMVLAYLERSPDHGYQLVKRLQEAGLVDMRPGVLYPVLRGLEGKGLLAPRWETDTGGPPKKIQEVTASGREYLAAAVVDVRRTVDVFESIVEG